MHGSRLAAPIATTRLVVSLSIFCSRCSDREGRIPMMMVIPESLHPDRCGEIRVAMPVRKRRISLEAVPMEVPTRSHRWRGPRH